MENKVIFGYRGLLPGPMGLLGCRASQASASPSLGDVT